MSEHANGDSRSRRSVSGPAYAVEMIADRGYITARNGRTVARTNSEGMAQRIARLLNGETPRTLKALSALLPNAHIEEVGDRRELVIYTGLSTATYDDDTDEWTERRFLVPMDEGLD